MNMRNLSKLLSSTTLAILLSGAAAWAETTVTAVMHSPLRVLDPVVTTAHITRDHGYMIYDVLVALDHEAVARPQMADWTVSDDALTWTFTLRDGLQFHDGAPVTAADVKASLERWGTRDAGGQILMEATAEIVVKDDRTLVWTLKQPFGPFLDTLAKQSSIPAFIMPARIAATPADTAITEYVGSGPFVFLADEFQPGVSASYARFEGYVPRGEPADFMAGGKVAKVDKIRWVGMPDGMTAINALAGGEIDYIEQVDLDLAPLLEGDPAVVVEEREPTGYQTFVRMNFLHPPFDNPAVRKAALMAIDQEPILSAMVAANTDFFKVCGAVFGCGTRLGSEAGAEDLINGRDPAAAKVQLEAAGYDGTPIVLMQPTDVTTLIRQPVIVAQQLREAGFNVDMQPMDWQSVVTRRANQAAPKEGGWNLFITNFMVPEIETPLVNPLVNGRGRDAWFGWPDDPELEKLRAEFVDAATREAQKDVAERIQTYVMESVTYIPLGQFVPPQARRTSLTGLLPTPVPVFWNVEKAE